MSPACLEHLVLLGKTVLFRPYVFVFLAAFLVVAYHRIGPIRALLWLVSGYLVAFASEYSSIHNGFPYGEYRYLPGAFLDKELWVLGEVPFMDSLSYVFLCYAGWSFARLLTRPLAGEGRAMETVPARGFLPGLWTVGVAAFLTMTLDVIIDPIALRGERWFLGKIYEYPGGGPYFGVPLENFAGWFLVALVIGGINELIAAGLGSARAKREAPGPARRRLPWGPLWGVGLYFGVIAFNIFMTAWVAVGYHLDEEWNEATRTAMLAMVDVVIAGALLNMLLWRLRRPRAEAAGPEPSPEVQEG